MAVDLRLLSTAGPQQRFSLADARPRLRVLPRLLPSEVTELAVRDRYFAALGAWDDHRAGCVICHDWCGGHERYPCEVGGGFYGGQLRTQRDWYQAIERAMANRRRADRVLRAHGGDNGDAA